MNDRLPDPLTPPDCDLSSMDWFPMFHRKPRRSAFWLQASAEIRAISFELWCEAFSQVPAASLPNDDVALSDAAGFGRFDLGKWRAMKPGVMAAWVLCSDGRWYHPFLAKVALEAFALRLKDRERKRGEAGEKAGKRLAEIKVLLEKLEALPETGGAEDGSEKKSTGIGAISGVTGQDRTGQDIYAGPVGPVSAASADLLEGDPSEDGVSRETILVAVKQFAGMARRFGLPVPEGLSKKRGQMIRARLREYGMEGWRRAIDEYERSALLRGESGRDSWTGADIDWLVRPTNFPKVIEGKYRDGRPKSDGGGGLADDIRNLRDQAADRDRARSEPLRDRGGESQ